MRLPTIKLLFSIFLFGLLFQGASQSVYAWPPVIYGSVRLSGTNAPLVNVEVKWSRSDNAERTARTDANGNFTYEPQDGWGCGENPHRWTVNLATVPFATVCGTVGADLNNVNQSTTVGTIPCNPPPPPPPPPTATPTKVPCGGPCITNDQCDLECPICTPDGCSPPPPTKVPCNGPCTSNDQCDLQCPICTPGGCAAPTPTPVPCGGPCTNSNQCDKECPICTPQGCKPPPTPTAFWTCGTSGKGCPSPTP